MFTRAIPYPCSTKCLIVNDIYTHITIGERIVCICVRALESAISQH